MYVQGSQPGAVHAVDMADRISEVSACSFYAKPLSQPRDCRSRQ